MPTKTHRAVPKRLLTHAAAVVAQLDRDYPEALCALVHKNPYELLVATILSAQCTDARVNMVTPALFKRFPNATALATADQLELEDLIRSTGFFRNKAKSLLGMAKAVVAQHHGEIPADLDALIALPGVGRKTAQVVLGTAFNQATGIVVDTHVKRLAKRMGLTKNADPVKVERDLMELIPRDHWIAISHQLIHHGRQVCAARKPLCTKCGLEAICPKIGVGTPSKPRKGTT